MMVLTWITGFSGAGKTTVAKHLQKNLHIVNIKSILLDGDEIRSALTLVTNYSFEERKKIAFSYSRLAKLLTDQGFYVIVATISMFEEVRQWNRQNNPNYFEVYLKVSEEIRLKRDLKGLYSSCKDFVINNENYEEPQCPDLIFDAEQKHDPKDIAEMIQKAIMAF